MPKGKLYRGIPILDGKAIALLTKDNLLFFVRGQVREFYDEICKKLPRLLEEYGISFGIKSPPELKDDKIIVAEGIPPQNGQDGRIEIVAKSWVEKEKAPNKDENSDRIDFKCLNIIKNVSKGEVIAKRILPTRGTPGKDVFGNEIDPKPGEMVFFRPGERVEIVDESTMIATDDGALVVDNKGTISVKTHWSINGDVDFSTGHVEFYGERLTITGSVLGGFTVECAGDVIIEKNIEDEAIVLTGGDLVVKGIIRSKNTMVKTGGNLICGLIENVRAFVGKDLKVGNYILNADCRVHGSVEVIMGKGLIAGGKIFMGGSLKVNTLGTPANVSTIVGAGLDPLLMLHYKSYIKEQESLAQRLEKVKKGLIKIKKIEEKKGRLQKSLLVLKENLQEAAIALTEELAKNRKKIKELEDDLGHMEDATITVFGKVHPNTTLKVFEASVTLRQPVEKIVFYYQRGEVMGRHLS